MNGNAGLRSKYTNRPPPFFKERRDDLLTRIPRKAISDLTRTEFLSLLIVRAGNLFSALKRDGLSSEACQIILKVFKRLVFHHLREIEENISRTCYLICPPPKEIDIDDKTEYLLNRLKLLTEARHYGQISVHIYNKMVLQIEEAVYAVVHENDNRPKRLKLGAEKPMAEASSVLAAIVMETPQGWPGYTYGNMNNSAQYPEDECKPQPNPLVYFGKVMSRSEFEEMLHAIESEWGVSFIGENDIRAIFMDESDNDAAYIDIAILSDCVFSVLRKMRKIPPEHSMEWYAERDREESAATLNKALDIIRDVRGSSITTYEIGPETKISELGSFFQRIRIYDKLQRLEDDAKFIRGYALSLLLCFSVGISVAWMFTQQTDYLVV